MPAEMAPLAKYLSSVNGVKLESINYRKSDSTFILEGDMVVRRISVENDMTNFNISDLKLSSAGEKAAPSISQRKHTNLISTSSYPTIRVRNACGSLAWILATSQAIRNFNHPSVTAMSKIRMVEVTSGASDVTVYETGFSHASAYAEAFLPSNNRPGTDVKIYTNANSAPQREKELVITHELGHTFGFRHTGTNDGIQIPYSPYSDPYSFMNVGGSAGFNQSFVGFTNNDIWAMYTMYSQTVPSNSFVNGAVINLSGTEGHMFATGTHQQSGGNYSFEYYSSNNFIPMDHVYNGAGVKIAAASSGIYYYITADKKIFRKDYPVPVQLPGEAIDIATNSSGEIFIVSNTYKDTNGNMVMKWNGTGWDEYLNRGAKMIALPAGPNAKPFVIDNSGQVYYTNGNYWISAGITTAAISIAACNNKNDISGLPIVYIISTNEPRPGGYGIFRWTGTDWFGGCPGGAMNVAVDGNGRPWFVTNTGSIFNNSNF
jgi:hypothetical protein